MRFKVGDLARFVVARHPDAVCPREVEVLKVGPLNEGDEYVFRGQPWISRGWDYLVTSSNEEGFSGVMDWQLRPIDPPAEPKSLARSEGLEHV